MSHAAAALPVSERRHPSSFRDPAGVVLADRQRILRRLRQEGADRLGEFLGSDLAARLVSAGQLVATRNVSHELAGRGGQAFRQLLEHERIPLVTYPYEWPFELLKAAALLHLDVHLQALGDGFTLIDSSAYNIQFRGPDPVFIDVLSFRRYVDGELWAGHRQFCEHFLNPLLLQSVLGVPHNAWFRGALEGVDLESMAALLPARSWLSPRALIHVLLPARSQRRMTARTEQRAIRSIRAARLPRHRLRALLVQLREWIASLERPGSETLWADYGATRTYDDAGLAAKRAFVAEFCAATRPAQLLDLSCNDGEFLELALEFAGDDTEQPYGQGWSDFEADETHATRRWAMGDAAGLVLSPPPGWAGRMRIGLSTHAANPQQAIDVIVDGQRLFDGWPRQGVIELTVPEPMRHRKTLRMVFRFAQFDPPGNGDPRPLAVAFDRLTLHQMRRLTADRPAARIRRPCRFRTCFRFGSTALPASGGSSRSRVRTSPDAASSSRSDKNRQSESLAVFCCPQSLPQPRTRRPPPMPNTDDTRIREIMELAPPSHLMREFPCTEVASRTAFESRQAIHRILHGMDDRLLVVIGPCSIHDTTAALEYARQLAVQRERFAGELEIVMRVYFEKPRTTVGWKGLINDPDLDGSFKINKGLRTARELLLTIAEMGLPAGTEFLDMITPQYIADLISWGAIGARTTESQVHRELASGLSCPVGFKNGTDGNLRIALDAIKAASQPHHFLSVTKGGHSAIVSTNGNEDCHVILRGGKVPNFDAASIEAACRESAAANLACRLMVDASHGNSQKKPENQAAVAADVAAQLAGGESRIFGMMIESHLVAGRQDHLPGRALVYGQSITDGCMAWDASVQVLERLAEAVTQRRLVTVD